MMSKKKIMLINFVPVVSDQLESRINENSRLKDVQVVTWPEPEYYSRRIKYIARRKGRINEIPLANYLYDSIKKCNPDFVVINSYSSTNEGRSEMIGSVAKNWCQSNLIPIAEYSDMFSDKLPQSQNLFELHVPTFENGSLFYDYVIDLISGLEQIRKFLSDKGNGKKVTYSNMLFELFDGNCKKYEFSQYFNPIFTNNYGLIKFINQKDKCNKFSFTKKERVNVLTYVLGHVLANSILRFPGPIISDNALCSYVAMDFKSKSKLNELFAEAKYDGPFSGTGTYFWKKQIDKKILKLIDKLQDSDKFDDATKLTRVAIESQTGRLEKWKCLKCKGKYGGFYCPYSQKTVCEYCSVSSSSWIPSGPNICRVASDFYNQWMPLFSD